MKTKLVLLTLVSAFSFQPSALLGQGSLTPPGAPAPTMKTLAQIEPRTPVGAATTPGDALSLYLITQPGAYYLTTNLAGVSGKIGIGIASDDVTLDLNGFAVIGVSGSSVGIAVMDTSHTNIAVRNGSVRGWGGYGMDMGAGRGCSYTDLRLSSNLGGLRAGPASIVHACTATRNLGVGISAGDGGVITACTSRENTNHGISASGAGVIIRECSSIGNKGDGIHGVTSAVVQGCTARENSSHGVWTDTGSIIKDCVASLNGTNGILARWRSHVLRNNCNNNTGSGIAVEGDASRVEANTVTGNTAHGIELSGTVNLVIHKSARGNVGGNYDIISGNRVGIIVVPTASGAITGNGPGSGLGTADPWANFAF